MKGFINKYFCLNTFLLSEKIFFFEICGSRKAFYLRVGTENQLYEIIY